MAKDVLYIDVEDDITAIISKVQASKESIVALVPPKRVGMLQSAVNMRLLAHAAKKSSKQLVLISSNSSLVGLAAAAQIPTAKNLQTKPELADSPELKDDEEDIIDGSELPIGEHAATAPAAMASSGEAKKEAAAVAAVARESGTRATPPEPGKPLPKPKTKRGVASKVPDFNRFRKRAIIIIVGALLLIGFLVWAIFFAPRATVTITARTTPVRAESVVSLAAADTAGESGDSIAAVRKEQTGEQAVTFEATGTKDVGEKARGTMTLRRTAVSNRPISIPAGTAFSAGDYTFTSTEAATLEATSIGGDGIVQDSATVDVVATENGAEYNLSARAYESTVDGFNARGSAMSGGSSRTVKVVSQEDVTAAAAKLDEQTDRNARNTLRDSFEPGVRVIDESYSESRSNPQSSPSVGEEANSATLTATATYRMYGIEDETLDNFLAARFSEQIENADEQKIYENGKDEVVFSEFAAGDTPTVRVAAEGELGPQIRDNDIKQLAAGKRLGEIQSTIESIDGVENVDVDFWPFWVRVVPDNPERVSVEFNVQRANE
ncbi:hypothetical protein FJZ39_00225 [Candidatus Saccharibacteria bacterium]|nr:hypothetical protein [Candidatus Saccharibacteria bacterium]